MSALEFSNMLVYQAEYLKPIACKLTRDNESASDLVQETLLRALSNKDKYKIGTNLKAWMFTIMRNIFINDYRKKARQRTVSDNSTYDHLINNNQVVVANEAYSIIEIKEIRRAIFALPGIFKIPFELYSSGYQYQEIAHIMKKPLGTIKSRIHFARKLLKEQLSKQ